MAANGLRAWIRGTVDRVDARLRSSNPVVRLARLNSSALRAYLRYRAAVEAGIGAAEAAAYGDLVVRVAERDGELARSIALSVPDHLARVRPDRRAFYFQLLREVLATRSAALPLAVRALPELLQAMEDEPLRAFLAQGLVLHGLSAQRAESFLRQESGQGRAAAKALRKGTSLPEVQRTLALYARAHCGEDVQVRAGQGRAFSDGHHVYLPESIDRFGDERDWLLYKVQTAIGAAYLEFGTFNLDLSRVPGEWPEPREGESEVERFLRTFSNRSLARDLFQVLEDARVEARLRSRYPGVARDLDTVGVELRGERPEPPGAAARAVESLAREAWGLPPLALQPAERRAIAPLQALLARVGELGVEEVAEAVTRHFPAVEALMRHVADEPPPAPPPPEAGGPNRRRERRSEPGSPQAAPAPQGSPPDYQGLAGSPFQPRIAPEHAGSEERRMEDEAREILARMRAEGADGDAAEARRRARDGERAERWEDLEARLDRAPAPGGAVVDRGREGAGPMTGAAGAGVDPDVVGSPRVFVYPEWDATIDDYKPAWTVVREQVLKEGSRQFVDQVMSRQKVAIDQLRRRFEALRPQGLTRVRGLSDGEDIDLDRAVAARIERRAGQTPDDRLYTRRHREQRDVAVALLLDLSSSTNESADGSSRRIIDVEKEALIVAAEALSALGDPFAVWGFSGYGREQVAFYVAKDFTDPWDGRARERVGRMSFKMENRDGAAIRHATRRLSAWPARSRLLILLSDGKPLDCGCDHYYDRYAQEDTRVALREARKAGVHPFCVTVDPTGPQYLKRMYGDVAYTVIDRVEALPARLVQVYRRLAL